MGVVMPWVLLLALELVFILLKSSKDREECFEFKVPIFLTFPDRHEGDRTVQKEGRKVAAENVIECKLLHYPHDYGTVRLMDRIDMASYKTINNTMSLALTLPHYFGSISVKKQFATHLLLSLTRLVGEQDPM